MNDEVMQKAEWRARLMAAVLARKHDDEILSEMLEAGLCQARNEGLIDAAEICERIIKSRPALANVVSVLALAFRELAGRERPRHGQCEGER